MQEFQSTLQFLEEQMNAHVNAATQKPSAQKTPPNSEITNIERCVEEYVNLSLR